MSWLRRFLVISVLLLSPWAGETSFGQADLPGEVLNYADTVLYNGKVLTADDRFTVGQAMAIRDGRVLAVGQSDRILKMAGPRTEKLDLQGKTVIPGFVEAHTTSSFEGGHGGPQLAWDSIRVPLENLDEALRQIRETAEQAGKEKPVLFFNASDPDQKYLGRLNRKVLDSVASDVPIVLCNMTRGVINSAALKLLPADLVAGPGAEKDAQGEPTGHVYMPVLGYLTYDLANWPDQQRMEKMLEKQLARFQKMNRMGIASVGGRASGLAITVLHELWQRGLRQDFQHPLPLRIRFSSEIVRFNPYAEGALKRIGNISGIGDEWFKLFGANLYAAGWVGDDMATRKPKRVEAGVHGPYGSTTWGYGLGENWKQVNGTDYRSLILANRYGWPITDFHANSDGEVDLALEGFDEANKERPVAGRRFGFVHGLMRTPDQIQQLGKYDAILSLTPKYLFYSPETVERLKKLYGPDALHTFTAFKSIIKAGMKPVLESNFSYDDVAGTTFRGGTAFPSQEMLDKFTYFWLVEKVITRKQEDTGTVWGPDERVSRQEALWMATNWSARFYQDETLMGTLEPGKVADFLILGADYMTVPEDKISEIPILQTVVGAKVVYENPSNTQKLLARQ